MAENKTDSAITIIDSKYKIIKPQYVVIKTGYVSRLWNKVDKNGYATPNYEHDFFTRLYDKLYERYCVGNLLTDTQIKLLTDMQFDTMTIKEHLECFDKFLKQNCTIEPLFCFDNLWGTGVYKVNSKEADKVLESFKKTGKYAHGVMCFKCDYRNLHYLTHVLNQNHYCVIYGHAETCTLVSNNANDLSFTYIEYDAESG